MKSNDDIRKIIQPIVKALREKYHPERIILFGSYASGRLHSDSDIDLLIIKTTDKPFFDRLVEVRQIVSPLRRGCPFDPLVLTPEELKKKLARGDQFFEEILASGRVLYARS